MWIATLIVLPFCWIETYTTLSWITMLGCCVGVGGWVGTLYYSSIATKPAGYGKLNVFDSNLFFGLAGQVTLTFEGTAAILNIRNEMRNQEKF